MRLRGKRRYIYQRPCDAMPNTLPSPPSALKCQCSTSVHDPSPRGVAREVGHDGRRQTAQQVRDGGQHARDEARDALRRLLLRRGAPGGGALPGVRRALREAGRRAGRGPVEGRGQRQRVRPAPETTHVGPPRSAPGRPGRRRVRGAGSPGGPRGLVTDPRAAREVPGADVRPVSAIRPGDEDMRLRHPQRAVGPPRGVQQHSRMLRRNPRVHLRGRGAPGLPAAALDVR